MNEIYARHTTIALDMVPTGSVSQRNASREMGKIAKDQLLSRESKGAERFGWSASVWLSKHLNGRQPTLVTKQPVVGLPQRSTDHASRRSQRQTQSGQ